MIKLFNEDDTTFETNGEVVLNPTYAVVHKEDNGDYYLDLETQLTEETKTIPAEAGTTVEIDGSGQITANGNKEVEIQLLKGQTSQASTPTPSSPVPINVVTGRQEINVCGKNICNLATGTSTRGNTTLTITDDIINFKTTGNINYVAYGIDGELRNANYGNYLAWENKILKAGTYALSQIYVSGSTTTGTISTSDGLRVMVYGRSIGSSETYPNTNLCQIYVTTSNTNATFTINEDMEINVVVYMYATNPTIDINFKVMLEKSSTSSTYSPYTGISQEINLGKNLAQWETNSYTSSALSNLGAFNITLDNSLDINTTDTYYFSADIKLQSGTGNYMNVIRSGNNTGQTTTAIINPNFTSDYQRYVFKCTYSQAQTLTQVGFQISQGSSAVLEIKNLMISKSNSDYAPYFTPIELCKIGTYQDFIRKGTGKNLFDKEAVTSNRIIKRDDGTLEQNNGYKTSDYIPVKANVTYTQTNFNHYYSVYYDTNKNYVGICGSATFTPSQDGYIRTSTQNANIDTAMVEVGSTSSIYEPYNFKDKWYIGKEIGKVVLDGSSDENISVDKTLTNSIVYRYSPTNGNKSLNSIVGSVYANIFSQSSGGIIWNADNGEYLVGLDNSGRIRMSVPVSLYPNVTSFKTLLSSNNAIMYYALATPTYTEITGELVGQLESMRLLNGLNNITITSENLTAPITIHYDYSTGGEVSINDFIQPNKILVANTPTGNQPFRISNIEKTRRKIKLQAKHLTYDSENYVIQDSYVVDMTCNQALDHLNSATDNTSPFTTTSDITTINSYRCVRKSLWEAIKVVIERWGGHLTRNNWQIGIMNSIGTDNGVVVRYAKNLKNIDVQYDWTNVVTKILPVGYDGLTLDEVYLYSDLQYEIPYTKVVSFEQDVDDSPYRDEEGHLDEEAYNEALQNDLRTQALAYLEENCVPKVNYELNANLEKITDIGDTIQVIDERLGINMMTSLISFDYDCILEKYKTLQFGNFRKTVSDLTSYISATSTEIADEISSVTKVTLQNELEQATSQIWGVLGDSYVIVEGDKILVVDSLPKETATNVIMINSAGIGFSNTGINGTFTSAWTIDNVLNMQNINVINLTADLIKGGSLKLGSNLNQNGILEVYDEANNLIAVLNKDGLRFNANDGGYILINTDVGFAGYDRNDNKVYWADGDEFHMKKSVVEEEITLVDKMTIIPITITDQNNNIVNDGIGFVSTL